MTERPVPMTLTQLIDLLRSPHADKVYLAKGYTKADLISDLLDFQAIAQFAHR